LFALDRCFILFSGSVPVAEKSGVSHNGPAPDHIYMLCTSFTLGYLFFFLLNVQLQLFNATVMWSETPMVSLHDNCR
jgi:hypothetical protein